ncbi:MAG: glycosyltransferase family 9 protein [Candidatus Omnitrophica bacterium]|nr:glycosyltransferase family 9 protein [Candidatus Omnitrophota bacterium]MCK5393638.1 glycosyltransferase family 9 protein [Candidatus Omnitrophota bacterium]
MNKKIRFRELMEKFALPLSIRTMRYLDRWVGVFLCFFLSGINYFLKIIPSGKKQDKHIRKILIIKLSEMGAIILSCPFIKFVREGYPAADIFFLTFKENAPVLNFFNINPKLNVLTVRKGSIGLFLVDVFYAIKRLRKEKIDIIFDLELFSRISAILTNFIGGFKKIGFYNYCIEGLYRGNFLTHKVQYNPLIHISESFISLYLASKESEKILPYIGQRINKNKIVLPKFFPSSDMKIKMRDKLNVRGIKEKDKLVIFNLGDGIIPLREWPLENFISIAKKILAKDCWIILVGTKKFSERSSLFMKCLSDSRCIDFSGVTTLPEILTLLSMSVLAVAGDCGLAHLASLVDVRIFVFFGPETPQVYSPLGKNTRIFYANLLCSPCFSAFNNRKSVCKMNECLKAIKVGEVYQTLKEYL